MSRKQRIDSGAVFLSNRLISKFSMLVRYPLTVVEGPLGYGKTVSLNNYLKKSEYMYLWQSVMDPSREHFWKQFCNAISQLDVKAANDLEAAGFPYSTVMACEAVDIIREAGIEKEVVIVFDDYHKVFCPELNYFFEVFARENISHIHIVLVGRNRFENNRDELEMKTLLYAVTEDDLRFTAEDCRNYFEECGISITSEQNRQIIKMTEGWIAAIYLILRNYMNRHKIELPAAVTGLFENSVYSEFTETQIDFLLRVCVFSKFTREQARFVRRKDDPYGILENLVATSSFVRFDPRRRIYYMHSLFASFLKEKLEEKGIRYRTEVCRHAADWYYLNGEYFLATVYYYRSGNFEDMLKSFERDKGKSLSAVSARHMIDAFSACPDKIRFKHHYAMMIYAKHLALMGEREKLKAVLKELKHILENGNLTEKEKTEFKGEYHMLLGYISYNDIDKITRHQKSAAKYLTRSTYIEDRTGCWTYGSPSVLHMFYREPGSLDQLTAKLYDSRDIYYKLTDSHGRGCEYILDAEREFVRDNLDKAEILSYKAYNVAKKYNQKGILIDSLFLQARIAMLTGKTEKGLDALRSLRDLAYNGEQAVYLNSADLCKAFIYATFNQLKPVDQWILSGDFSKLNIYEPTMNFLYTVYGRVLLDQNENSRLLGMIDFFQDAARNAHNLMTELYMNIYSAVAYSRMSMEEHAARSLEKAIAIAAEDKMYTPFVENGKDLFNSENIREFLVEGKSFIEKCEKIYRKYEKNLNIFLKEDDGSPLNHLTKREQEISLLVAEGMTNMEIARELSVAEITVKKSLSNIYSKLGVSNRTSLIKKISS